MKVTASGEGELTLDFEAYARKRILGRKVMGKTFKLSAEPRTFSQTFKVPAEAISLVPEIVVNGTGKAVVTAFEMDLEQLAKLPEPAK